MNKIDLKTMVIFGIVVGTVSSIMNCLVSHIMDKHHIPEQLFGLKNQMPERLKYFNYYKEER